MLLFLSQNIVLIIYCVTSAFFLALNSPSFILPLCNFYKMNSEQHRGVKQQCQLSFANLFIIINFPCQRLNRESYQRENRQQKINTYKNLRRIYYHHEYSNHPICFNTCDVLCFHCGRICNRDGNFCWKEKQLQGYLPICSKKGCIYWRSESLFQWILQQIMSRQRRKMSNRM